MRLLECESKDILNKYQIVTPSGSVVVSVDKIEIQSPVMLKAQVPIGGRAKAGGILEALNAEQAKKNIKHLLSKWVTGYRAKKILMEEKLDIEHEYFMAITVS